MQCDPGVPIGIAASGRAARRDVDDVGRIAQQRFGVRGLSRADADSDQYPHRVIVGGAASWRARSEKGQGRRATMAGQVEQRIDVEVSFDEIAEQVEAALACGQEA